MEKQPVPYKKVVFICTNERPPGVRPSCCGRGSAAVHSQIKARVKALGLDQVIRVSKSGCLNQCDLGPNILVFPDNIWYSAVTEADVDAIVADIVRGIPGE
jgi:(2Fe-2S) ferredoxin